MHTLGKRFVPLVQALCIPFPECSWRPEERPHVQNPKTGGIPEVYRQTDNKKSRVGERGRNMQSHKKLILVAEGAVGGVVCAGGYFLTPSACFQWASLNTGSAGRPVGLYFPKAGATELYSLFRLCVITEQRQEGCSALKQHNPTSNPHSNHLLPPSEKER